MTCSFDTSLMKLNFTVAPLSGESMGIRMRKKISQLDVISFAAIGADFERVSVGGHIWVDDTQREFWKLVAALAAQVIP